MNCSYSEIRCQLQKSSKKRPGIVRTARDERALARLGEIAVDPARGERDLVLRERPAHADGAVAAESVDELGGDHRRDRRAVESPA